MEDNNLVLEYLQKIKAAHLTKEAAINFLTPEKRLTSDSKNLIISYCFPRPLGDYELPSRVSNYRNSMGINQAGSLQPIDGEVILLIEAGQTTQYGRFIKHIMHAFCDPELLINITGNNKSSCCICGKQTCNLDLWKSIVDAIPGIPEETHKEWLTFGSKESEVTMCLDCIVQLVKAKEIMDFIDPSFYDWTKRKY